MQVENSAETSGEHPIDRAARLLGGRATMATRFCVSLGAIGNWKARMPPEKICVLIERSTAGAVTRRDLRPDDWHEIWPELASDTPITTTEPATAGD